MNRKIRAGKPKKLFHNALTLSMKSKCYAKTNLKHNIILIAFIFNIGLTFIIRSGVRDDTHMTSMKIVQFSRQQPPCPSTSKILPPP